MKSSPSKILQVVTHRDNTRILCLQSVDPNARDPAIVKSIFSSAATESAPRCSASGCGGDQAELQPRWTWDVIRVVSLASSLQSSNKDTGGRQYMSTNAH